MAFLNNSGLRRYTTKILDLLKGFVPVTRKINGKTLTEDIITHTAGDGVSIEGDVISLNNPVRGVMTQMEYDALSKEEQDAGTYFVYGAEDEDDIFTSITDEEIEALFG